MEKRIDQIELEQTAIKKRLEAIETARQSNDFLLRDMAHKQTMAMGIAMTTADELRDFKLSMQERLSRLDDRVSSAHQELAELQLTANRIETKQDTTSELLNQHSELLKLILEKLK
jgi:hypothetical protein